MDSIRIILIGIIIPFIGTVLGSACVFFLNKNLKKKTERFLLGFAAGLMIVASVWSLLIPSIEMAEEYGYISWVPASIGFLLGVIFLITLDIIVHYIESKKPEEKKDKNKKSIMLAFAIMLHNIPEGMAVGVVFAGLLTRSIGISVASAMIISIGIAIQNFPEGAIISLPLKNEGMSRLQAFGYGAFSGAVEPISAIVTISIANFITPILPFLLAFASGAMIYVVVKELIPEACDERSNVGTIGVAIGFVIMMILDIVLG